jgi:pyruvate kinase
MSVNARQFRRTKIVATWGPAVSGEAELRSLIQVGVDVFRLNSSHATHAELEEAIPRIRRLANEEGRPVALLQDIQGPRIRTGRLAHGAPVQLKQGRSVTITSEAVEGTADVVSIDHRGLAADVAPGQRILIADGTIVLRVASVSASHVNAVVELGGPLGEHKGVNLPDSRVSVEALTEKDRNDLAFGVRHGVEYVALSFVRRRDDILACRSYIHELGGTSPIIAKIEHPEAITNLEEILIACDGIMVARGDLGVEISPERVPLLQKRLIRRANEMGLPVITATQMLESMVERSTPTRAEASDVANAVLDGTDALMLSAESAIGRYPVQTVQTMVRIALEAEGTSPVGQAHLGSDQAHAMALAARDLAERLDAKAIVVFTKSGRSAQVISHQRPLTPVYAFTDDPAVCRQLALWHGVTPILTQLREDPTTWVEHGLVDLRRLEIAEPGDSIVVIGASPWMPGASTNFVTVRPVPAVEQAAE